MTSQGTYDNWLRGYVFVQVSDPVDAAERIMENNEDLPNKEEQGFIIRADEVKDAPGFNLVIPINYNADFEQRSTEIMDLIEKVSGVSNINPALVETYNPEPPHNTPGVVTVKEANPLSVGPQDHNVWG